MTDLPCITYFDIRGRAEPVRLILEDQDQPYEDRQVLPEEWSELKPTTPFGALPLFSANGLRLSQSHAIYRHLARTYGLYPAAEADRARCDVAIEALRDAKDQLGGSFWRPRFEEGRAAFLSDEIPITLARLETFLAENPKGPAFWVGETTTLVDYLAFAYVDDLAALYPGALRDTPRLDEFTAVFQERPQIARYLASARRPAAIQYGPNGKIFPAEHETASAKP